MTFFLLESFALLLYETKSSKKKLCLAFNNTISVFVFVYTSSQMQKSSRAVVDLL